MNSQEEDGKLVECFKDYVASESVYMMEEEEAEDESREKESRMRKSPQSRMSEMISPCISIGDDESCNMDGK